jgi:site-specific DNA-methyltransferase (adenine-specific)
MLEPNKIYKLDVLEGLSKLDDNSFDVIIIDPPYNIGKDFGINKDNMELKDYIEWSKKWVSECVRVLKPRGTMFIYGFSEILAHIFVEIPLQKRWLVWHYTNKNVESLDFWQRSHESLICCWKYKPIFNRDCIREPYTETFLKNCAGKPRKGTKGRFSKFGKKTIYNAHENGALPRDVIKIPALAGGAGMSERWFLCKTCDGVYSPKELSKHTNHDIMKHPTQKPLELSKKLILSAKPEGSGVVLVPFAGSGTECLAAKILDMDYIGFEINPDYIKLANGVLKMNNNLKEFLSKN